jgi:hypothetical protein
MTAQEVDNNRLGTYEVETVPGTDGKVQVVQARLDTNNGVGDAFGRVRTSSPQTIFDSKQIFDNSPLFWDDQETSGGGTGSTHNVNTASSTLSVSASTAGTRVRQTFQWFNYQPGKSQQILMTFVLDNSGGGAGITRRVGQFNANNGLFLEDAEGTYKLVRRTYVSGSAVDNAVAQSAWNIDKLDGTGASGITLDFTKTQILVIDYEWLGVGRVRIGFNVNGVTYLAHQFLNANVLTDVYMSSPNLPLRFELSNSGTGVASTFKCICCSVSSEGGSDHLGILRYASTGGTHVNADAAGTIYAVVGLRLKAGYLGCTINPISWSMLCKTPDDLEWMLYLNPTVAGTFTYADETNSAVQTAKGATTNTVTNGIQLAGGFIASNGTTSGGSSGGELDNALRLGSSIAGTPDQLVLCVRPLGASADVDGGLTWRELV